MRKNYSPFLKKETKLLIEERKAVKEDMSRNGDYTVAQEVQLLARKINKALKIDKKDYYDNGKHSFKGKIMMTY